jgi:hypothetical protein
MDALERYTADGHRQVEGWLSPEAIQLILALGGLQRDFEVRGRIAKIGVIGVHHGRLFTLAFSW